MKLNPALLLKNILPRTLFGRALIIIISPLILLQIISTHIFYDRHWDTITRRLSASIAGDIVMVLDQLRDTPVTQPAAQQRIFIKASEIFGFTISMRPGEILPNTPFANALTTPSNSTHPRLRIRSSSTSSYQMAS